MIYSLFIHQLKFVKVITWGRFVQLYKKNQQKKYIQELLYREEKKNLALRAHIRPILYARIKFVKRAMIMGFFTKKALKMFLLGQFNLIWTKNKITRASPSHD